jgi:hypothetical protein
MSPLSANRARGASSFHAGPSGARSASLPTPCRMRLGSGPEPLATPPSSAAVLDEQACSWCPHGRTVQASLRRKFACAVAMGLKPLDVVTFGKLSSTSQFLSRFLQKRLGRQSDASPHTLRRRESFGDVVITTVLVSQFVSRCPQRGRVVASMRRQSACAFKWWDLSPW